MYIRPRTKEDREWGRGEKDIENEIKTRTAHHFSVPDGNLQNNKQNMCSVLSFENPISSG